MYSKHSYLQGFYRSTVRYFPWVRLHVMKAKILVYKYIKLSMIGLNFAHPVFSANQLSPLIISVLFCVAVSPPGLVWPLCCAVAPSVLFWERKMGYNFWESVRISVSLFGNFGSASIWLSLSIFFLVRNALISNFLPLFCFTHFCCCCCLFGAVFFQAIFDWCCLVLACFVVLLFVCFVVLFCPFWHCQGTQIMSILVKRTVRVAKRC